MQPKLISLITRKSTLSDISSIVKKGLANETCARSMVCYLLRKSTTWLPFNEITIILLCDGSRDRFSAATNWEAKGLGLMVSFGNYVIRNVSVKILILLLAVITR